MMKHPPEGIDQGRRALLGVAVGVTTAVVAPGLVLHAAALPSGASAGAQGTGPVTDSVRWGLLIDTSKCVEGCRACVDACDRENGLDLQTRPAGQSARAWADQKAVWVRKVKLADDLTGRVTNLPLMCQHCEHPPCVDVCPTGASFKRADGIVLVDRHTCIGCRYCMMACPYQARSFIHEVMHDQLSRVPRGKGCVESCNLCVSRRDHGAPSTACADACAEAGHHAIVFGDLKDPQSAISQALKGLPNRQLREDLALNTGVRYAGV
jgi:molybdopterin-containing oxidoreductase family iron-sulfur binding subunit